VSERSLRIRGHHLICLQFFHGEGYSPEFVRILFNVIDRLARGEKGIVVIGADDVCAACPALAKGQCARNRRANRPFERSTPSHSSCSSSSAIRSSSGA
jgi:hypothetical protein